MHEPRAAARAAAAVDRPRRAGRGRRRRRRASPRSSTSPRSAPTSSSSAAAWSPASTSTPRRQAVLRATVAFAREVGARVVAEGVERAEELEALRDDGGRLRPGLAVRPPGRGVAARSRGARRGAPVAASASPGGSSASSRARRTARATPARRSSSTWPARGLLPSVYLEQGGRLRCQAVRGYWQIYDGMPADRRRRSGAPSAPATPAIVDDVARARRVPARRRRACAPRSACRCASPAASSACSTPSRRPRSTRRRGRRDRALRRAAGRAAGGARRARRRLAGAAAGAHRGRGSASLEDAEDIVRETLAAALALSGFESAMLALADGHGGSTSHHAEGSFAVAFGALDAAELDRIADLGRHGHVELHGRRQRRAAGSRATRCCARPAPTSLIVLPLVAAGERLGLLVVADRANHRIGTREGRAARAAGRPGGGRAADGRRGARAARARRARPADRPRPPRHLLRRGPGRARRDARGPALRRAGRRRRRLQGDQRRPRPRRRRRRAALGRRGAARGCRPPAAARSGSAATSSRSLFECAGESDGAGGRLGPAGAGPRAPRHDAVDRAGDRRRRRERRAGRRAPTRRSTRSSAAAATASIGRSLSPRHAAANAWPATVTRSSPPSPNSPSTLSSTPRRQSTSTRARGVLDRLLLLDRPACAGPRRGGRAPAREPAGRITTSSSPSPGSATPISEPPPNAPLRRRSPARRRPRSRPRRRRGRGRAAACPVAAARSAPTP